MLFSRLCELLINPFQIAPVLGILFNKSTIVKSDYLSRCIKVIQEVIHTETHTILFLVQIQLQTYSLSSQFRDKTYIVFVICKSFRSCFVDFRATWMCGVLKSTDHNTEETSILLKYSICRSKNIICFWFFFYTVSHLYN